MGYNLLTRHQIFAPKIRGATAPPEQARRQARRQKQRRTEHTERLKQPRARSGAPRAPRAQLNKIFRFYIVFIEL